MDTDIDVDTDRSLSLSIYIYIYIYIYTYIYIYRERERSTRLLPFSGRELPHAGQGSESVEASVLGSEREAAQPGESGVHRLAALR